jgi:hypothetical protein
MLSSFYNKPRVNELGIPTASISNDVKCNQIRAEINNGNDFICFLTNQIVFAIFAAR